MSVTEFGPRVSTITRPAYRGAGQFGRAATMLRVIALWRRQSRDRAELAQMGYLALQDLGVPDPALMWHEASRPFWQNALAAWREAARARGIHTLG
jgi:uncharacterized protein YjiS (DUF1127 family)